LVEACAAAEVAREAVETAGFLHDGNKLSITASFGVAELHIGEDAASLLHRADQALRLAKDRGRNAVYWHDGENLGKGLPAAAKIEPDALPSQPQPSAARNIEPLPVKAETARPLAEDSGVGNNLANRTMFCSSVRLRISEWKRGGSPVSILLLKVNLRDKSGAVAPGGVPSRILHDVATHIQTVVRGMDMAGYYAHACFCLLIPAANPLTPDEIAERVKEQLFHLSTSLGAALELGIGMATVTEGDDAVSLLKRAENDLLVKDRPSSDPGRG
jgi:PleD family two-component response regulator